jgi:hypothetical protein
MQARLTDVALVDRERGPSPRDQRRTESSPTRAETMTRVLCIPGEEDVQPCWGLSSSGSFDWRNRPLSSTAPWRERLGLLFAREFIY